MNKKTFFKKIKESSAKRDNRFWLMISVTLITITIFAVWLYDIKNTYSGTTWNDDLRELGLLDLKNDGSEKAGQLFSLLEEVDLEALSKENLSTTSAAKESLSTTSTADLASSTNKEIELSPEEIDNLKILLGDKKEKNLADLKLLIENQKGQTSSTSDSSLSDLESKDLTTENLPDSSVPSLYPELDDSEKVIRDLKEKIKNLEPDFRLR